MGMLTFEDFDDTPTPVGDEAAANPTLDDVVGAEAVADTDQTAGLAGQIADQEADTSEAAGVAEDLREAAEENPSAVSEVAVEHAIGRANALLKRYGYGISTRRYSKEDFGSSSDRAKQAKYVAESIMDKVKDAGKAVVEFFKRLWEKFTSWISSLFNSAKSVKKAAEEVEKLAKDRSKEKAKDKKVKLDNSTANLLLASDSKEVTPAAVASGITAIAANSDKFGAAIAEVKDLVSNEANTKKGAEDVYNAVGSAIQKIVTDINTAGKMPIGGSSIKIDVTKAAAGDIPQLRLVESAGASAVKDVSAEVLTPAQAEALGKEVATAAGKFIDDKRAKELQEALKKGIEAFTKFNKEEGNNSTKGDMAKATSAIKQTAALTVAAFTKQRNQALKVYRAACNYGKKSMIEIKSDKK